ncbi:GTPase Era [Melioribacteraceae bacterium 4301-Me]|uniref:GTPase Era n=1 Tax=Pyranulibacter aquaticus TaxID=3163344 RepID=UPI00359B8606
MAIKSGYVSIIGKPNTGKSTLMNVLLGERLSITTNKPQTTRKKILGILSAEDYQIIFLDTPGILTPRYLLQEKMLDYVYESVKDADIILMLIDISDDPTGKKFLEDEVVNKILSLKSVKKILAINKVDLSNESEVKKLIEQLESTKMFDKLIPISAITGYNIAELKQAILEILPEHPKYYPDDQLSDRNERFFVSEIIREKIFELFHDEIPYSTEIEIEDFKERTKGKDYILANIIVERETQKPIIIGQDGISIKKIGKAARRSIEDFLGREVYLELRVKVKEKWRSDPSLLKKFGYDTSSEG